MVPGRRVFNLYGPTEATIWSTFAECVADGQPPPIGRPIGNVRCYVLDRQGQLVPRGVAGELYIGGVGVARGYWKREEQSTQRFLPDPFIEDPKARMYRTGDLVRWRADGQLEFQGRIDTQVKVRGFRIELGEVEAVLRRHPGVGEAVVECREDAPGDRRLVAYLVAERSAPPPVPEIRDFVSARLPGYMVPASWVVLPALPLTPNGKVDRKALPAPDGERQLDDPFVAARNELEADICTIWCEVLQLNRVGIDDNFFELGGNSLLLIRMRSLLAERLGREVPVVDLFESPTIRLLASRCAKHIDGAAGRHSVQALSKVHARARSQRKAMRERQEAAE